jgi:pilus assembly protein CpaB
MKKKRLPLLFALAATFGLLAAYLSLGFLRDQPARLVAAEAPATAKMVVAARDLPLGTLLRAEDVRAIDWPAHALPAGYAASPADVLGRGVITPVATNEPLLAAKLSSKEEGGGLPIVIPEGMRALSVRVDEVVGVAGFVVTGTRVDVLVTINPPGESGRDNGSITRVILQNVETLAAGQTYQRDAEGKPQTVTVITLLVTPEQAERLTLAANDGRIQLALRNTLDMREAETPGVRATALVRPPATPGRAVQAGTRTRTAEPRGVVVETYRGGVRTLSTFSGPNTP